jgi:hypothetical protein
MNRRGNRRASSRDSNASLKNKQPLPRTAQQYFALPDHAQEQWRVAEHVIQKMRSEGISLTRASKEYGINRKKVIELGGSALRKQKNGRYQPRSFDRMLRVLTIPYAGGPKEVAVRDSRTASKLAEYSNAVEKFADKGDRFGLSEFKKLRLKDAEGKPIKLLTDIEELKRLRDAGLLSFESLYARSL